MSFWGELRRRNVVKVGVAYAIVAWLLAQISSTAFPALQLPAWTVTFVIALVIIGFPIALLLAWAYEVTPEGIRKTRHVPLEESVTHLTGQKLNYIVTALLVLGVGFIAADTYWLTGTDAATETSAAAATSATAALAPAPSSAAPAATAASATTERPLLPNSVAVLPFENMSPSPDDAYFAAGIHEEILNYLAKLKSLNVIARTSMMRYAGTGKSIQEIADELNVETVMEGSVRYAGDRVRVTTQLIDAATGAHLWSEAYERDFADIFAVQADIAMNVANALDAAFSPEEQRQIETAPTRSTSAYADFLRFLQLASAGNQGRQIIALTDRVIAADPEFAAPHGWKAQTYANLLINTTFGSAGDRAEMEALARASAERALALDPSDRNGSGALALIELFHWRWPEARRAYESNDGGPYYHWFTAWSGRAAEAIRIAQRNQALNPLEAGSYWHLGIVLTYAGRLEEAAAAFRRAIEFAPSAPLFHTWLAWAEIARGNPAVAQGELELAEQLLGDAPVIIYLLDIMYAYGRLGQSAEVERLFAELEAVAATQDIGAGGWAMAYLAIGDEAKALEQLRLGVERARAKELDPGFFQLMNLRMNVNDDPVLEQPEFVAVRAELTGG